MRQPTAARGQAHELRLKQSRIRGLWPLIPAVVASAIVAFLIYAARSDVLMRTVRVALQNPDQVDLSATLTLILGIGIPLLAGAGAGFVSWQAIRLLQLNHYLREVHRSVEGCIQQTAALSRLGYIPRGLPFAANGLPDTGAERSLAAILPRARGILLLGDNGVGKTLALLEYARELSSRRRLLAIALGQSPLPLLVPLAAYADAAVWGEAPDMGFLAAQLRAYGAPNLSARLPWAINHWNVAVLCDGLDEVPTGARARVAGHFAQFMTEAFPSARLVMTCALTVYLAASEQLTSLSGLERVVITGIGQDELPRLLRQA
ncbi:MAG TPA: hypothetical protein VF916_04840, partial [Ktedonobacterales bacterium]